MDFFAAVDPPPYDDYPPPSISPSEIHEIRINAGFAAPAKKDPFDPAQVKELFDKFHGEIDTVQNRAIDVVVDSDQSYADAQEMLGTAKKLASAIDKKRRELKEPYLAFTRVLDGEANGLSDRLKQIATGIETGKLLPYARMKEAQRREAEQRARAEAAARQAELDAAAKAERDRLSEEARAKAEAEGKGREAASLAAQQAAAMAEPAPMVVPDIPKETKVTTDNATTKIKMDWDWAITDFSKIPADIWDDRREQVSAALRPAITARVKSGIRNIPGIQIFQVERLESRTRR